MSRHHLPMVAPNFMWSRAVLGSLGKVSVCPKDDHKDMSHICMISAVSSSEKRYALSVPMPQTRQPKLKAQGCQ